MPTYSIKAPDGRTYEIEGPAGATQADVIQEVLRQNPRAGQQPKPRTGLMAQLSKGAEGLFSSDVAGVQAMFGDADAAATNAQKRQKGIASRYADETSLKRLEDTYNNQGLGAAVKEGVRQLPLAVAGQLPQLAKTAAAAKLGAMAGSPLGPVGALAGGALAGVGVNIPTFTGENVVAQKEAAPNAPVNTTKAVGTAVGQATLDTAAAAIPFGKQVVGKLFGPQVQKMLAKGVTQESVEAMAKQGLMRTIGKGAAAGVASEVPTEVLQTAMERAQAGLSLTDADAQRAYTEAAYGAAQLAPIGGAGHVMQRSDARTRLEEIEAAKADAARVASAQQAQAAEEQAVAEKQQKLQNPDYVKSVEDDYRASLAKRDELKALATPEDKDDPASVARAAEAKKLLDAHMEELNLKKDAYNEVYPAIKAREKAAADEAAAKLVDPEYQAQILAQLEQAQAAVTQAKIDANAAVQAGDFSRLQELEAAVEQNGKLAQELQGQLGERPETPRQKDIAEKQAELTKLRGSMNPKGVFKPGTYAAAMQSGDMKAAAALRERMIQLQQELQQHEDNAQAAQRAFPDPQGYGTAQMPFANADTDADVSPMFGSLNPSGMHPTGDAGVDATMRQTFGADDQPMTRGDVRTAGKPQAPVRVAKPQAKALPTTGTQDALFPDMEQGGDGGTPIENLTARIAQLKQRPNTPAATLAQLENYERVLANPALADTANTAAQNALETIADNVDRIAYRGEGQGVERNASMQEIKSKIAAVDERLRTIGESIAQAKQDGRAAGTDTQYERSNELRELVRTEQELRKERARLNDVAKSATQTASYPQRATQFVPLNGVDVDATPEQIERAKRGDKRGTEIGTVNAYPGVAESQTPVTYPGAGDDVGFKTETRAAPAAPTTTGTARVTRVNEKVVGQQRQGPDDADLQRSLAEMSPKDTQTLDLWDGVFGNGTPAARMVEEAAAGVEQARTAVARTQKELEATRDILKYHKQTLAKAMQKDPAATAVTLHRGQELEQKRALERAQRNVDTAEQVKQVEGATADEQVRMTQQAVQQANEALDTAEQKAESALAAFRKEWAAAKKSGWLTPELEKFLEGRVVKDDLQKAQQELVDIAARSNSDAVKKVAAEVEQLWNSAPSLTAVQQAHSELIARVRKSVGPRVAGLLDNMFKLHITQLVVGDAQALADVYADAQVKTSPLRVTAAQRAKEAAAAIRASDKQLTKSNLRVEIAQLELAAAQKRFAAFEAKLEGLGAVPLQADTQAAEDRVKKGTDRIAELEKEVVKLTANADERVLEARTNLARAKQTQQALFENEAAMRDGKPMPLQQRITELARKAQGLFDEEEARIQSALVAPTVNLADAQADIDTVQQQLDTLQAVETELTTLLQEHVSNFLEVQEQVETLLDTSTLLASDAFDPARENAQRIVNRAGTRAQLQSLLAEEARTMSQRDVVLKRIDAGLTENTNVTENAVQSDTHRARLAAQRSQLQRTRAEREKFFTERLQALRGKIAALEPEMDTAPDPALQDWGRTQIESLRSAKDRLQQQIETLNAQLKRITTQKERAQKRVYAAGAAQRASLDKLNLGRDATAVAARRAPLFDALVASITHQRSEERKADARVATAFRQLREARHALFDQYEPASYEQRAAADAKHQAFRSAAMGRARLHDDLVALERGQLALAQELAALPTPAKPAAATNKPAQYRNIDGRTVDPTQTAPEAPAGVGLAGVAAQIASGTIQGPVRATLSPEMQAFSDRINNPEANVRGLRRYLGALKSEFESETEDAISGNAGRTLTTKNGRLLQSGSALAQRTIRAQYVNKKSRAATDLYDKIRMLETRIANLVSGKGLSAERIAATQPSPGRRGVAMKKDAIVGSMPTGSPESRAGANDTGSRNPVREEKQRASPTAAQVTQAANKDTAKNTQLRILMEQAQLEREADSARAARAAAQDRYDAVMAAPKASDAAKANVKAALDTAKKVARDADKALAANARTDEAPSVARTGRTTTTLDTATEEAVMAGDTQAAVESLIANGSTPEARALAAKLQPLVAATTMSADASVELNGQSVPAKYAPADNHISLQRDAMSEEDLLHELSHAATDGVLVRPESELTPDQRAAKNELEGMRRMLANRSDFSDQEIDNVREFAAEVYSNADLRAKMDSIGKPRTLLQRFVDAVKRLFGFKPDGDPLSKKASALVDRILSPAQALGRGDAAPSVTRNAAADLADDIIAKPQTLKDRFDKNFGLSLEMAAVDMRAPAIKALKAAGAAAAEQASYYIRKADARMSHTFAALSHGPLGLRKDDKGFYLVEAGHGPNAKILFDAVGRIPGKDAQTKMNVAQVYLTAKRAQRVGWDKLGFDPARMEALRAKGEALMTEVNADPATKAALENVSQIYNDYNKGLINFMVETGTMPKAKGADLMKHGDYVPFYRVMSDGSVSLVLGEDNVYPVGNIRTQPYLQELKGGDQKLLPLNEAVMRNTMMLTDMAMRNLATKESAYALQQVGKGAGPMDKRGVPTNKMSIHRGKPPTANAHTLQFRQEPDPKDPKDDGDRYIVIDTADTAVEGIPSDMLAQSFEGSFAVMPAFLKAAGWFGDVLRSGVTRNPMYVLRQLIRDPMAASFTGGADTGIVGSVLKTMAEFGKQTAGTSKTAETLVNRGLVHSNIFTGDPDDMAKFALQLAGHNQSAWSQLMGRMDTMAMRADGATRATMYESARKQGMSEMQAEMAAIEMMNFNKRGMSPSIQYASRMIPFFNAQIQGLNVLYKAATGNMPQNERLKIREKFYRRAMTMAAFTLMYAAAMDDDETYQNARARDRYNNWLIPNPMGGEHIKIPIPFEVGMLFKMLPEALLDTMKDKSGPEEWGAVKHALLQQIPGSGSFGLPQAVRPTLEVVMNHSLFSDRPIETEAQQKLDPQQRFTKGTTELAKSVSGMLGMQPIEALNLSPLQVEHLARGYLGSLPIIVARMTNSIFDQAENAHATPTARDSDNPLFGALFQKQLGSGPVDAAYAQEKAIAQAVATHKKMFDSGNKAAAAEYKENVLNVVGSPELAKTFHSRMSLLRKAEEAAKKQIADPDALRERLDALETQKHALSNQFLDAVKQIAQ